ncbi:MAG: MFS transporter [Bifidobacterium sp.]|uniref:MFS transporter n=1 Tax=Bifidobacterium fermentum TaxID=3059035 RepID=A0AB39UKG0_9BIFI
MAQLSTTPAERGKASTTHISTVMLVVSLSLGGVAFAILQSLVSPALPVIAKELSVSTADISWVLTAYLLSASVCTPILGKLGDMIGKRRVLLAVLIALALGSALSGIASSFAVLILGRVLQGAAGAILPLSIGIARDLLPAKQVGVTVGLLSALFGIGGGLGIVLAGPIVDNLSWNWLFWFPLILVLLAIAGAVFMIPESRARATGKLDWIGTIILSAGLVTLLLGINKGGEWGWHSAQTLISILGGVVCIAVFVFVELPSRNPLINMHLLKLRGVWTTNIVGLAFGFLMYGTFLIVPTLLQLPTKLGYGFGETTTQAGFVFLPTAIAMLLFGPVSGWLGKRLSPRLPLILGSIVITFGFLIPALGHGQLWQIILSCILTGAGVGLAFAAMSNVIIGAVPAENTAEATSVNTIVRTIGGGIGTAVLAATLSSHTIAGGIPTDSAFTLTFWICTGIGLVATIISLAVPRQSSEIH